MCRGSTRPYLWHIISVFVVLTSFWTNIIAGIAKYEVKWVSQAAASQRSGRAGRTGPGHCYRLYSANFYHEYLQPYQPPEITVTPLEELILQVSS